MLGRPSSRRCSYCWQVRRGAARYWKPVQSGSGADDDTAAVRVRLAAAPRALGRQSHLCVRRGDRSAPGRRARRGRDLDPQDSGRLRCRALTGSLRRNLGDGGAGSSSCRSPRAPRRTRSSPRSASRWSSWRAPPSARSITRASLSRRSRRAGSRPWRSSSSATNTRKTEPPSSATCRASGSSTFPNYRAWMGRRSRPPRASGLGRILDALDAAGGAG